MSASQFLNSGGVVPENLGSLEARVERLVTEGEGEQLEYKRRLGDAKVNLSFAETVAAFANGVGGLILVGVGDDSELVGFDPPNAKDMITDIVRNHVVDPVAVTPERVSIQGKPVWVVTVPAQADEAKPFRCSDKVMVRAGGTTRVASTSELRRLASGPKLQEPRLRWSI